MSIHRQGMAWRKIAGLGLLVLAGLAVLPMLSGCTGVAGISFLDPQGPVAAAQKAHLLKVTALSLIVVLPVLLLVPLIAWRYRRGNKSAKYTPDWAFSRPLEIAMWSIPATIVVALGLQLWRNTEALNPYTPLPSSTPALRVEVVGLDWKWLFIYPDLGLATVGELAFPQDRPLSLRLTSDTVLQSFMVPALGGQIYAMPGMQTQLNLQADKPGRFGGLNTQFNGSGFQDQRFSAVAMAPADFDAWVGQVRRAGVPLDAASYAVLGRRSTPATAARALGTPAMPPEVLYFKSVTPDLFAAVMHKYMSGKPVLPAQQPGTPAYRPPGLKP